MAGVLTFLAPGIPHLTVGGLVWPVPFAVGRAGAVRSGVQPGDRFRGGSEGGIAGCRVPASAEGGRAGGVPAHRGGSCPAMVELAPTLVGNAAIPASGPAGTCSSRAAYSAITALSAVKVERAGCASAATD